MKKNFGRLIGTVFNQAIKFEIQTLPFIRKFKELYFRELESFIMMNITDPINLRLISFQLSDTAPSKLAIRIFFLIQPQRLFVDASKIKILKNHKNRN